MDQSASSEIQRRILVTCVRWPRQRLRSTMKNRVRSRNWDSIRGRIDASKSCGFRSNQIDTPTRSDGRMRAIPTTRKFCFRIDSALNRSPVPAAHSDHSGSPALFAPAKTAVTKCVSGFSTKRTGPYPRLILALCPLSIARDARARRLPKRWKLLLVLRAWSDEGEGGRPIAPRVLVHRIASA